MFEIQEIPQNFLNAWIGFDVQVNVFGYHRFFSYENDVFDGRLGIFRRIEIKKKYNGEFFDYRVCTDVNIVQVRSIRNFYLASFINGKIFHGYCLYLTRRLKVAGLV